MATELKTQQEIYDTFKNEAQSRAPQLTDFAEGAINDAIAGATSTAVAEILRLIIEKFNKTYVNTAHGPEVTGGPDDLEYLLVDHFGEDFARPEATPAVGTVTFSRASAAAGDVEIAAGTIVKTVKNSNGEEQRFSVVSAVTMTGLSINASVEAVVAGSAGNVGSGTVTVIETTLTDPTVGVTNSLSFAGGDEEMDDSEYREYARNKIEIIRGATKTAIEAAANNVPGVEKATAIESLQVVIEYDIGMDQTVGTYFRIPRVKLYISDANGTASDALIDLVEAAIEPVRACGVKIEVIGADPLEMDWSASITLNPSGPNFSTLSVDTSEIVESMAQYIRDISIGDDFNRINAAAAIMAIWGPAGTNDLTSFSTSIPSGNISTSATEKLLPGDIEIV